MILWLLMGNYLITGNFKRPSLLIFDGEPVSTNSRRVRLCAPGESGATSVLIRTLGWRGDSSFSFDGLQEKRARDDETLFDFSYVFLLTPRCLTSKMKDFTAFSVAASLVITRSLKPTGFTSSFSHRGRGEEGGRRGRRGMEEVSELILLGKKKS